MDAEEAEETSDELLKLADEYKRTSMIDVGGWRRQVEKIVIYAHLFFKG